MAVAITGGDVLLEGARPELLQAALDVLAQTGAEITSSNEGIRVKRNGGGIAPVDVDDRSLPGLPDRPAGAVHGADVHGRGHLAHHRDDLREPLHACAGAGAARRAHPARWRDRDDRGRRRADGRSRDGDGPARLGVAGDRRRWRPRARRWSTASITSTAASSGWRTSSDAAAQRSSGSAVSFVRLVETVARLENPLTPTLSRKRGEGAHRRCRRCSGLFPICNPCEHSARWRILTSPRSRDDPIDT